MFGRVPDGGKIRLWRRGMAVAFAAALTWVILPAVEGYSRSTVHFVNGLQTSVRVRAKLDENGK